MIRLKLLLSLAISLVSFSAIGPDMNHFVLELPEPIFESAHDVIELKR